MMDIFKKLFQKDKPLNRYDSPSTHYMTGRTVSGVSITDRNAIQQIAVYACIRVLSEAVAQLPLHVYERTENGRKRAENHVLYSLLHDQTNREMTSFAFRETMMLHLLVYGNAYAQIIRNGRNEVVSLYPLMANRMKVDRDNSDNLIYIYNRYENADPNLKQTGEVILSAEDVLHIPGLGFDGLVGYSPIAVAKNALGIAKACEDYGANFFANGASPSGVLEHPGTIKDFNRIREGWKDAYGGNNSHKTAILEEGMKYTPISIPNNDAQFLETRKFQLEETKSAS